MRRPPRSPSSSGSPACQRRLARLRRRRDRQLRAASHAFFCASSLACCTMPRIELADFLASFMFFLASSTRLLASAISFCDSSFTLSAICLGAAAVSLNACSAWPNTSFESFRQAVDGVLHRDHVVLQLGEVVLELVEVGFALLEEVFGLGHHFHRAGDVELLRLLESASCSVLPRSSRPSCISLIDALASSTSFSRSSLILS